MRVCRSAKRIGDIFFILSSRFFLTSIRENGNVSEVKSYTFLQFFLLNFPVFLLIVCGDLVNQLYSTDVD